MKKIVLMVIPDALKSLSIRIVAFFRRPSSPKISAVDIFLEESKGAVTRWPANKNIEFHVSKENAEIIAATVEREVQKR